VGIASMKIGFFSDMDRIVAAESPAAIRSRSRLQAFSAREKGMSVGSGWFGRAGDWSLGRRQWQAKGQAVDEAVSLNGMGRLRGATFQCESFLVVIFVSTSPTRAPALMHQALIVHVPEVSGRGTTASPVPSAPTVNAAFQKIVLPANGAG